MKRITTRLSKTFPILLFLVTVLVTGLVGCMSRSQIAQPVRVAYGNLEEMFQTEVLNIGLEQLGYNVIPGVEEGYDVIHQAVANGYLDYTAVHWHSLHNGYLDDGTSKRVGTLVNRGIQGYLIDKATADEYGITSIEDLQDPEIAELFDIDGDGKANLAGCNDGWGCKTVIDHHLDEYGLLSTVEHDTGQYSSLMEKVINRFDQGNPVLYYTWIPYWVSTHLQPDRDVVWLEVPHTSLPDDQGDITEEMTSAYDRNLGFKVDQIGVLANSVFLEDNPTAHCFFQLAEIDLEDIIRQNQLMQEENVSAQNVQSAIRKHAEDWIGDNQETFESWLTAARQSVDDSEQCSL